MTDRHEDRNEYIIPEETPDASVNSAKSTPATAGTSEETGNQAGPEFSDKRSASAFADTSVMCETNSLDEADGSRVTENTKTWSLGKRILRCVLYGILMALILLVAEGAWRDDFVEGVVGVADSSILGAPLVALMVALLESGGRWLMTLRASRHPGFDRERFLGYLGVGFWITLGFELIMCLATMLGGGVMDVNVRFSTVICQVATLVIMAVLMWQEYRFRALFWPVLLYFLWLTPLLIVLPGSRVITATQRSIVTFELIYGALLCLLALIVFLRNRRKTQEDLEEKAVRKAEKKAAKAEKKLAKKDAKAAHMTEGADDISYKVGESEEIKATFDRKESNLKSVEQKYLNDDEAEVKYGSGNVEDRYL